MFSHVFNFSDEIIILNLEFSSPCRFWSQCDLLRGQQVVESRGHSLHHFEFGLHLQGGLLSRPLTAEACRSLILSCKFGSLQSLLQFHQLLVLNLCIVSAFTDFGVCSFIRLMFVLIADTTLGCLISSQTSSSAQLCPCVFYCLPRCVLQVWSEVHTGLDV